MNMLVSLNCVSESGCLEGSLMRADELQLIIWNTALLLSK